MEQPIPLKRLESVIRAQRGLANLNVHSMPKLKQALILFTTVSSVAMLTGCGLTNPFASQRPDQVVTGERRVPVYNSVDMQKMGQSQQSQPAASAFAQPVNNAPPAAPKADGYDYYGAAAGQPPSDSSGKILGTLNPAPVKTDPALTLRKPLPQNIYNGQNAVADTVPASSRAMVQTAANAPPSVSSLQTTPAPVASYVPAPPQPVQDAEAPVEKAPERPSFFARLFGSSDNKASADNLPPPWKSRGEFDSDSALSESEKNAPYAPLSSVPPSPSEFKNIKADRDQEIQDLQNDHAAAQQQKEALSSEPSQEEKVTPVEMPAASNARTEPATVPAAVTEPVVPNPSLNNYPVTAPEQAETPRMPRRGIDIMTQDEWDALQKAKLLQQSTPPAMQQSVPPTNSMDNAAPAQQQQNFTPAPAADQAPAPSQPMATPSAAPPTEPSQPDNNDGKLKDDGLPQLPVPTTPEPVSENQPDKPAKAEVAVSSGQGLTPATEVAEHRPSFFARLFTPSPDADGVKEKAPASAQTHVAEQPAPSQPVPVKTETASWAPSLISDSQAHPVDNTDTAPPPVATTSGNDSAAAPMLIGEISDKSLSQPPASEKYGVATPLEPSPQPTLESVAEKPVIAEKTPAVSEPAASEESKVVTEKPVPSIADNASATVSPASENDTKSNDGTVHEGSFFSRLFENKPASPSARDGVVVDKQEEKTATDALPAANDGTVAAAMQPAATAAETDAAASPLHRSPFSSPLAPKPEMPGQTEAETDNTKIVTTQPETPVTPAAPEAVTATAPQVTPSPAEATDQPARPSFFSRVFAGTSQPVSAEATQKDTPAETGSSDSMLQPSAALPPVALPSSDAAAAAANISPSATPPSSDSATATAASVEPVTSGDGTSSLPSPQLLEQVKMMPASRYSARARALKQNPDDN